MAGLPGSTLCASTCALLFVLLAPALVNSGHGDAQPAPLRLEPSLWAESGLEPFKAPVPVQAADEMDGTGGWPRHGDNGPPSTLLPVLALTCCVCR